MLYLGRRGKRWGGYRNREGVEEGRTREKKGRKKA